MSRRRLWPVLRDLMRFGAVGTLGVLVDVALFNLLRVTVLSDDSTPGAVLIAKAISGLTAIAFNWAGNRWWAFRDRRGEHPGREALAFLLVSLGGGAISLVCLGISHYLLGLTSPLADNISANLIGLALGSAFRFIAVRTWLFRRPTALPARTKRPVAAR